MMDTTTLPELTRTMTVCHAASSEDLLAQLAQASGVLARKARRAGRPAGEVEIEHTDADTYVLTWKDADTVSDEPTNPPFVNQGLSEGSGSYLSRETINGVGVGLLRNCNGHALAPGEVRQVMEYRLTCIDEELAELDAHLEPEDRDTDPQASKLLAVRAEYRWFLKLLVGPQRT